MNITKHRAIVTWSEEDQAFLAATPDLRGCIAHGDTREEAMSNLEVAINEWLQSAKEEGWSVPAVVTHQECVARAAQSEERKRQEIQQAVEAALAEIVPKIVAALQNAQRRTPDGVPCTLEEDSYEFMDPPSWRG